MEQCLGSAGCIEDKLSNGQRKMSKQQGDRKEGAPRYRAGHGKHGRACQMFSALPHDLHSLPFLVAAARSFRAAAAPASSAGCSA